jgi:recombination protein RecT
MNELAEKRKDIRSVMEGMKGQFALALPKMMTIDRFLRVALTCVNKNPKLLLCTQESLLACLLDCAALGIEPDGRRAHLIPYGQVCTLIIDYKGIAELVRRSGEVSTLHCGIVYPSDDFDYAFGTGQFLKHRPTMMPREGEKPLCVYSYVKLKDGQEDFDVMSIEDVERVRKRSRAGTNGPWVTDFDEMAKKTVFRRHSKWLPLSPELRDKLEKDDEPLTEQERLAAAKPAQVSNIQFGEALSPEATETAAGNAATPKRNRRTKAEMEAARAKEEKPEAPATATPLEGLTNLMRTSLILEKDLLVYLFAQLVIEQGDTLATLSEEKIKYVVDNWVDIAQAIKRDE